MMIPEVSWTIYDTHKGGINLVLVTDYLVAECVRVVAFLCATN